MNEILLAFEKLIDSKLNKNEKEYYDVQETCIFLGISKSTLYKFNLRKVLPYFRPRKKIYYLKTDLIKYLSENRIMSEREISEKARQYFQNKEGGNHV